MEACGPIFEMADAAEPAWRMSNSDSPSSDSSTSSDESTSSQASSSHALAAAASPTWAPVVLKPCTKPAHRPGKYPPGTTRHQRRLLAAGISIGDGSSVSKVVAMFCLRTCGLLLVRCARLFGPLWVTTFLCQRQFASMLTQWCRSCLEGQLM